MQAARLGVASGSGTQANASTSGQVTTAIEGDCSNNNSSTPPKNTLHYISDLINKRRSEHGADPSRQRATKGLTIHNFGWTKKSDVVQQSTITPDDNDISRVLDIDKLLKGQLSNFPGASGKIRSKGLLQFVVLQRTDRSNSGWMLPSPQQFHDLINSMESEIIAKNLDIICLLYTSPSPRDS